MLLLSFIRHTWVGAVCRALTPATNATPTTGQADVPPPPPSTTTIAADAPPHRRDTWYAAPLAHLPSLPSANCLRYRRCGRADVNGRLDGATAQRVHGGTLQRSLSSATQPHFCLTFCGSAVAGTGICYSITARAFASHITHCSRLRQQRHCVRRQCGLGRCVFFFCWWLYSRFCGIGGLRLNSSRACRCIHRVR
jgi:hypothetical protein